MKRKVIAAVDDIRGDIVDLSQSIHQNPELAFEEYKAMQWLTEALEAQGFTVDRGVGGLETSFCASYRGGDGPVIAFLAEYDALAGIGHGCGHNIIGAAAVGAAIAIKRSCKDVPGTIKVIGTPAEEGGGGKVIMADEGIFDRVDVSMIVHPMDSTEIGRPALAVRGVSVEFFGRPAHAAADPDRGINALDAVIQMFVGINGLRQHIRSDARIQGIITNGGEAVNIVPDFTSAELYVRALDDSYTDELTEKVTNCARAAALATGCRVDVNYPRGLKGRVENSVLDDLFAANWSEIGVDIQPSTCDRLGSTDVGNLSHIVPTVSPFINICDEPTAGHTEEFCRAAASAKGDQGAILAAKGMAATAVDLFEQPKLVDRAKAELKQR